MKTDPGYAICEACGTHYDPSIHPRYCSQECDLVHSPGVAPAFSYQPPENLPSMRAIPVTDTHAVQVGLLSCPFCDSLKFPSAMMVMGNAGQWKWFRECGDCGARSSPGARQAVDTGWNRRSHLYTIPTRLSAKMARLIMEQLGEIEEEAGRLAQAEKNGEAYDVVFIAKVSGIIRDAAKVWKGRK